MAQGRPCLAEGALGPAEPQGWAPGPGSHHSCSICSICSSTEEPLAGTEAARKQGPALRSRRHGAEEEAEHAAWQAVHGDGGVSRQQVPSSALLCWKNMPNGWSQGHVQQAVDAITLAGTQVFAGTVRCRGWMQPCQNFLLWKGLENAA